MGDLNQKPQLPYEDNAFDFVVNAVSVDYLTRPYEMFAEIQRVLKPGGLAAMSFSNRCFPTKAISVWTSTGDQDHIMIVAPTSTTRPGSPPPRCGTSPPRPTPSSEAPTRCTSCTAGKRRDARGSRAPAAPRPLN